MKRIIRFSRFFVPATILSALLIAAGIGGYAYYALRDGAANGFEGGFWKNVKSGFNLGVDFQAGLIQEVQFAPTALTLRYEGTANATVSLGREKIDIVISGVGVDEQGYTYPFSTHKTVGELAAAIAEALGVKADIQEAVSADTPTALLIMGSQGNPLLGAEPFLIHYLPEDAAPVAIDTVREALDSLGELSVQVLGTPAERRFMIRVQEEEGAESVPAEKIFSALEEAFGSGEVAVTSSEYVGSRFSKQLTGQAGYLLLLTLVVILVYASIRFKPQYAIGAVLAILHDALIMVAFIVWTRMEFNTTTIAAILTILGYSINDTIVIFDRIRETRRIYPDDSMTDIMNRSISETLSRTIITTLTTMLAVVFLFVFTTGSMKDFALSLLVGMTSGVYSTIFIACGFVNWWDKQATKRKLRRKA
jgi:preprotein translocase subunit SecF